MSYTLDANILINMERRYPREFFASLWNSMETAAVQGEISICQVVCEELERGDDGLAKWAKEITGFVRDATDEELALAREIALDHPDWVQEQRNYGDPFVIAHAKEHGVVVVTEEKRKGPGALDKNQTIPNIAEEYGVTCIDFFGLLRKQGWRF